MLRALIASDADGEFFQWVKVIQRGLNDGQAQLDNTDIIFKGRANSIHSLNIDVVSYALTLGVSLNPLEKLGQTGYRTEAIDESGSKPTLPSSSSRDVCSPGEMVLGVEVPLQDPFTPVSCGNVIERGEHS